MAKNDDQDTKIKVEARVTKYTLTKGKFTLSVDVDGDKLTLYSLDYNSHFEFDKSKKSVVKALGELFIEASKLK
jgi:hypothetical protein